MVNFGKLGNWPAELLSLHVPRLNLDRSVVRDQEASVTGGGRLVKGREMLSGF
jgi:hypothetical protein